jgi:hypothetical protein
MEGAVMTFNGSLPGVLLAIFSTIVFFAVIAFVIIFIIKAVKYFIRQEKILLEISAKIDRLEVLNHL